MNHAWDKSHKTDPRLPSMPYKVKPEPGYTISGIIDVTEAQMEFLGWISNILET